MLVIDDFGRQKLSPVDLLNRWITPLESRVDYLTLQTGQKFAGAVCHAGRVRHQPQAADLVDEAFLRRIHYKVFAESPTRDDFKRDLRALLRRARHRLRRESLVDWMLRDI